MNPVLRKETNKQRDLINPFLNFLVELLLVASVVPEPPLLVLALMR